MLHVPVPHVLVLHVLVLHVYVICPHMLVLVLRIHVLYVPVLHATVSHLPVHVLICMYLCFMYLCCMLLCTSLFRMLYAACPYAHVFMLIHTLHIHMLLFVFLCATDAYAQRCSNVLLSMCPYVACMCFLTNDRATCFIHSAFCMPYPCAVAPLS